MIKREFNCHYGLVCDYKPGDNSCAGCDYWYEDISGCFVIDEDNLLGEIDSAITTEGEQEEMTPDRSIRAGVEKDKDIMEA